MFDQKVMLAGSEDNTSASLPHSRVIFVMEVRNSMFRCIVYLLRLRHVGQPHPSLANLAPFNGRMLMQPPPSSTVASLRPPPPPIPLQPPLLRR